MRHRGPEQGVAVVRKRGAEVNFDPGADRIFDCRHVHYRRVAVALGAKFDPTVAGNDNERSFRCQHGTGDNAQPVAERAAHRKSQQLGGDQRTSDAKQPRNLFRRAVDAGAVVRDEVTAAGRLAELDGGPEIESVVGQFLEGETAEQGLGDTGLLLKAIDGAEQRPVFALEF